jgi:cell division protein FtsI/penicillin-binding protein 2
MGKNGFAARDREQPRPGSRALDETPASPGKQLKLTVDLDLQIAAEQASKGRTARLWPWIRTPEKSWRW